MYRLFRRFEKLAFGMVTASAVACAGFIFVERWGGVFMDSFVSTFTTDDAAGTAFACEHVSRAVSCSPVLSAWKGAK